MTNQTGRTGLDFNEPLIFERSVPGAKGIDLVSSGMRKDHASAGSPQLEKTPAPVRGNKRTSPLLLPEVSEPTVMRHYTRMSRWNYAIDIGPYPLGSCTMKYNPKINEWAARLPGFAELHPYMPEADLQGALSIMWDLQEWLKIIGGFEAVSLQPAAGAQGEFLGMKMIVEAIRSRGEKRKKLLVPESAHGTNPATAAFFGLDVVPVKGNKKGCIDLDDFKSKMDRDCVGIMITNPNTLGIFESDIVEICQHVHELGGFVYGDGANLNALMGVARPGDFGIDVMHFNLHKTFTTPHGGGGPGCGGVGASKALMDFLPDPLVVRGLSREGGNPSPGLSRAGGNPSHNFSLTTSRPLAVERIRSFYGNFGMMVRAWTYIRELGMDGCQKASELAVLNANYIRAKLKDHYHLAYQADSLHEVVLTDRIQKENGVTTFDIAKRLMDYGFHPPTVYFPLVVHGALMIEPTETESKQDLDDLCDAFIQIALEAKENPELVKTAPHNTAHKRIDEVTAARKPVLTWVPSPSGKSSPFSI